jgi:hypothetical protein
MKSSRRNLGALKNLISQADHILATTPPLPDDDGIVWLSFRVDAARERKTQRTLAIATRAIARDLRLTRTNFPSGFPKFSR